MGKRKQEYDAGKERLCDFLEASLNHGTAPSEKDILNEIQAIDPLRPLNPTVQLSQDAPETSEPFFFLLCEEYDRYDDIHPSNLRVTILPQSMDEEKEIYRFLTSRST